ncbi:DUF2061 domain-containing protein [Candidatus Uhrbacteria bacterium]|nr:DUF2061 domain-containing protein [Candidatus Uhrbacteria bacterium]
MAQRERFNRSLVKTLAYRFFVLMSDSAVVYFVTHRLDVTIWVVTFSTVTRTLLYLLYERFWNNIDWGRE